MTSRRARTIKFWTIVLIVAIALIISATVMLKYEVEGEKEMPYTLSKITLICTAEGIENTAQQGKEKWNLNIIQTNDVYISIDKNEKSANKKTISSVTIENMKITKSPNAGKIKIYMPNSEEGRIYSYTEDYEIYNSLEYRGGEKSNPKTLEIGSQGGMACISFANVEIGTYKSNTADEIEHNGKLIGLTDVAEEDLKFSISFDLIINVDGTKYKTTVNLDLPCGEIIENGTATMEITDFSNLVFKRI